MNCLARQLDSPQQSMSVRTDYDDSVAVSRAVINARFAPWVKAQMDDARDRGMSDAEIEAAIGFPIRTAYRWAAGAIGPKGPNTLLVMQFCDGLGASRAKALALLDLGEDEARTVDPEPVTPPEFRALMRRLNDPNVSKQDKDYIRETLRRLIATPRPKTGTSGKGSRSAE